MDRRQALAAMALGPWVARAQRSGTRPTRSASHAIDSFETFRFDGMPKAPASARAAH